MGKIKGKGEDMAQVKGYGTANGRGYGKGQVKD